MERMQAKSPAKRQQQAQKQVNTQVNKQMDDKVNNPVNNKAKNPKNDKVNKQMNNPLNDQANKQAKKQALKRIKAVIFDLDDTLMDTSGQLLHQAQVLAVKAMIRAGLLLREEDVKPLLEKVRRKYGALNNSTTCILDELGVGKEEKKRLAPIGHLAYHGVDVAGIKPFPGTTDMLEKLRQKGVYRVLMSHGTLDSRERKLAELGITQHFDSIVIDDSAAPQTKEPYYQQILTDLKKRGISAGEVLSVGDRVDSEIQISKRIGMITVQVTNHGKGRYSGNKPTCANETPDYKVNLPADILEIKGLQFGE